jgi:O-antigen/teichoic acid export membrane protein
MAGEQRACAIAYASAFAISLVLNIAFVMWLGALGAAIATSVALMSESILLFALVKRRLGIDAFIGIRAPGRSAS